MSLSFVPRSSIVPAGDGRVTRRLDIATTGSDDVLPRALSWLRRRGCTFVRVDYGASDRLGPATLAITVQVPGRHADRLAAGLENLVEVTAVRVE